MENSSLADTPQLDLPRRFFLSIPPLKKRGTGSGANTNTLQISGVGYKPIDRYGSLYVYLNEDLEADQFSIHESLPKFSKRVSWFLDEAYFESETEAEMSWLKDSQGSFFSASAETGKPLRISEPDYSLDSTASPLGEILGQLVSERKTSIVEALQLRRSYSLPSIIGDVKSLDFELFPDEMEDFDS